MKVWNNNPGEKLKLLEYLRSRNNIMKMKKKDKFQMKKMIIDSMEMKIMVIMASRKITKLKLHHLNENNNLSIKLSRKGDNKLPNKEKDHSRNSRKRMNHSRVRTKSRNHNWKRNSWRKSPRWLNFRSWIGRTWRAKRTQADRNRNRKHSYSRITFKISSNNSDTLMSSITKTWWTLRGSIHWNKSNNYLQNTQTNRIIIILISAELVLSLNKT